MAGSAKGQPKAPHPRAEEGWEYSYQPKTPLGKRLLEIRKQIIESGEPLLDWDDLQREIAERRGGWPDS